MKRIAELFESSAPETGYEEEQFIKYWSFKEKRNKEKIFPKKNESFGLQK